MTHFSDRLCQYPLVSDSLKMASDAYSWVSSGERFRSVFQLSESAFSTLKEKAKAVTDSGAVAKMDEIACHQILDRMESVFPSVKKPSNEFLGPIADTALSAAESYLEYFLPDTKANIEGLSVETRYDRLIRLQSALANSDKVQAAQNQIASAYKSMLGQLSTLTTAASKERRDAMLLAIHDLAAEYKKAAEVAFPSVNTFVSGAVEQLQNFTQELRKTDNLSQLAIDQLSAVVDGLHGTLVSLNDRREKWLRGYPSSSESPDSKPA